MQRTRTTGFGLLAIATLLWSAGAAAKPVLEIDFRDTSVWGGYGQTSYSYGGITVEATPNSLYHDAEDGYGVLGGHENDEIDGNEILKVSFDETFFHDSSNYLTGVLLTDLFWRTDGSLTDGTAGWVTLFLGGEIIAQFVINAANSVYGGNFYIDFGGAFAPDSIIFTAYTGQDDTHRVSDYSVAGFTTVPEPAALLMMGTALLIFARRRSRREELQPAVR